MTRDDILGLFLCLCSFSFSFTHESQSRDTNTCTWRQTTRFLSPFLDWHPTRTRASSFVFALALFSYSSNLFCFSLSPRTFHLFVSIFVQAEFLWLAEGKKREGKGRVSSRTALAGTERGTRVCVNRRWHFWALEIRGLSVSVCTCVCACVCVCVERSSKQCHFQFVFYVCSLNVTPSTHTAVHFHLCPRDTRARIVICFTTGSTYFLSIFHTYD